MWTRVLRKANVVVLPGAAALFALGCGGSGLPSTQTIALPDGTQVEATMNSGVLSFADSRWELFSTSASSAQGLPFVIVRFGPVGELEAFEDSTLASDIFGSEIVFDGTRHDTTQQGLQYAAATYGAQTSDASGFAFVGNLNAFVPVIGNVANATATAGGQFDGDNINTISGTFDFESHVTYNTFDMVPEEYIDMEETIHFIGHRIIE